MPLPVPKLDSRTWDELIAEALALVPDLAPRWTDHNTHDPGITLIELFAWLTELQLFQLDRVPPELLRAYLRMAGVEPAPAGVAATTVALRRPPTAAPLTLPAGFSVCDTTRATVFQSTAQLTVSEAWLELDPAEGTDRGRIVVTDASTTVDVTAANGRGFAPFGDEPRVGAVMLVGFTERPAAPFSLYAWSAAAGTPVDEEEHYWARTTWEQGVGGGSWAPLDVGSDATRALTRDGSVVLAGLATQPDPADGRHWIRCRLLSGSYECPPILRALAVNATPVHHAATAAGGEQLGVSRGTAGQTFRLVGRPAVASSTALRLVVGGAADDGWQEVAEWDLTGPDDRHYRLDPAEGTITFGDGRRGRVPRAGAAIEARHYQVGGGEAGNVPAGILTRTRDAGALLPVIQPYPATGGSPAEPLAAAHGRALDLLTRPTRGVTTADLEALALETPGVPVGRAHAVPGHHRGYGCLPAAGVVTVVVLPRCGAPPTPSAGFLRAVCRHLEPRRPLTTELHVVGPAYVTVSVSATLHVAPGAPTDLAGSAGRALTAFFHPLHGGTDGRGWPFGRDVYETEVMAMLNALPGVRYVDRLGIRGPGDTAPRCGNLPLCPTDLVWSGAHRIDVEESER
jgi:Baseplate J-like protein